MYQTCNTNIRNPKNKKRSIITVVQNVESCCQNRRLKSPFVCFQTNYSCSTQGNNSSAPPKVIIIQVNAPAVPVRFFSPTPTAIQEVADRIFYILSLFDKIDQEKLALDCRFDKVGSLYAAWFMQLMTFIFRIWDWTVQIQPKLQWQSRMNLIWKFQLKPWIFFWNVLELIVKVCP